LWKAVERGDEGLHRLRRLGADLREPVPELLEVVELGRRHLGQLRLVRERRRQLGVLREPLERRQLPVRERAEQVHDRGAVLRIGGGRGQFWAATPVGRRARRRALSAVVMSAQ